MLSKAHEVSVWKFRRGTFGFSPTWKLLLGSFFRLSRNVCIPEDLYFIFDVGHFKWFTPAKWASVELTEFGVNWVLSCCNARLNQTLYRLKLSQRTCTLINVVIWALSSPVSGKSTDVLALKFGVKYCYHKWWCYRAIKSWLSLRGVLTWTCFFFFFDVMCSGLCFALVYHISCLDYSLAWNQQVIVTLHCTAEWWSLSSYLLIFEVTSAAVSTDLPKSDNIP